jgi:hypothetical protein
VPASSLESAPAKPAPAPGSAPAPANLSAPVIDEEIVLAKPEGQDPSLLLNIKLEEIKSSRDGFIKHIKEMKEDKLAKASKELIDCLFGEDFLKEKIRKEDLRFSGIFYQEEGGGFFIKNYDIVKRNIGILSREVARGEDSICTGIGNSIKDFNSIKKEDRGLEIKKEGDKPFDLGVFTSTSTLLDALLQKLDEKQRVKGFEIKVAGSGGATR